jgi:hypothetical protein
MGVLLKIVWGTILTAIIGGLITLSLVGIPAPSVKVKKQIPLENILK